MILEKIAADTKLRVEKAKRKVPYSEICRRAMAMDANTGFPFEKALAEPGIHYICEVKKASPSKGVIAQDFPYNSSFICCRSYSVSFHWKHSNNSAASITIDFARFAGL